jgi:hypothetical protein
VGHLVGAENDFLVLVDLGIQQVPEGVIFLVNCENGAVECV